MTDKEKIRVEIEKLISRRDEKTFLGIEKNSALKEVLSFIDSMQEESVSEELEDAAFDYAEACKYEGVKKLLCVEHFKAGAKWQNKQDQETIEVAEDHAMLAGMEKAKEQIMKNLWKPSDEQMEALKQAKTNACGKPYFNALASLYVNLKGY